MRRVPMVVAAGVTTAIIVLGVNALAPVGARETPGRQSGSELVARFADCVRDRGVTVPALQGAALDRWFDTAHLPVNIARACKTALAGVAEKDTAADGRKLADCLRAEGLAAPTEPAQLKAWIARQDKAAIGDALEKCGMSGPEPSCGPSRADAEKIAAGKEDDQ